MRCRAIQRRAEIVAIPKLGHARVQPHPHPQRNRWRGIGSYRFATPGAGVRGLKNALGGKARSDAIPSRAEDRNGTVACGLNNVSTV